MRVGVRFHLRVSVRVPEKHSKAILNVCEWCVCVYACGCAFPFACECAWTQTCLWVQTRLWKRMCVCVHAFNTIVLYVLEKQSKAVLLCCVPMPAVAVGK